MAFGTTTGLLVAIIAALSVVVILQCVRKRNGNGKTTMMAYFSTLYSSSLNYVNMQNSYIDILDNDVNMRNNYVDMLNYIVRYQFVQKKNIKYCRHLIVNMQGFCFVDMRHFLSISN